MKQKTNLAGEINMGSYRYCVCGNGLPKPTAQEDLLTGQICSCGEIQESRQSIAEWIVDLEERLVAIENSKKQG
jgi:hypothetical protein